MMSVQRSIVGEPQYSKSTLDTHFRKNGNVGRDIGNENHISALVPFDDNETRLHSRVMESKSIVNVKPHTQSDLKQHNAQLDVERSILVSDLPDDASQSEIIIHFQSRKCGGGDVERIICQEEKGSTVVLFSEAEDAKSVLKNKQRFRNKFQLTIGPVILRENVVENGVNVEEVTFESVSGLLHPKLFKGLTEDEVTSIIEKVNENTSVRWVPSNVGLLSTGTITQLETARNIIEEEVQFVRTRKTTFHERENDRYNSRDKHVESTGAVQEYANKSSERENEKASTKAEAKFSSSKPDTKENVEQRFRKPLSERFQTIDEFNFPRKTNSSKVAITQENATTQGNSRRDLGRSNCFSQTMSQRRTASGEKPFYKNRKVTNQTKKSDSDVFRFVKQLPNMVSVKVIQGDLTNQQDADVIVNPCHSDLQNMCGVGASIIDNGGLAIQIELNRTLESQEILPPGKIIKTSAGSLPYQNIYHVVCPQWGTGVHKERSSKVLHAACLKSLQEFSETELTTIAYPIFSSSAFPMPQAACAQVMLNAVNAFAEKRNPNPGKMMNVLFVINNEETLGVFQIEFNKLFATPASQKTKFSKTDQMSTDDKPRPTLITRKKMFNDTGSLTTKTFDADEATNDKCPVCLGKVRQPKTLEKCQHTFCRSCVDKAFQVKKTCPLCKISYAAVTGNQPDGKTSFTKEPSSLPGFTECGTITITYHFKGGYQGARHPNPGQRYLGTTRVAYLPDNREGNEVLGLLQKAFDDRFLFKIGTIGLRSNQITWGDIDLKTVKHGGPANYGYPDEDYLLRVKEQLASKGIYP